MLCVHDMNVCTGSVYSHKYVCRFMYARQIVFDVCVRMGENSFVIDISKIYKAVRVSKVYSEKYAKSKRCRMY